MSIEYTIFELTADGQPKEVKEGEYGIEAFDENYSAEIFDQASEEIIKEFTDAKAGVDYELEMQYVTASSSTRHFTGGAT